MFHASLVTIDMTATRNDIEEIPKRPPMSVNRQRVLIYGALFGSPILVYLFMVAAFVLTGGNMLENVMFIIGDASIGLWTLEAIIWGVWSLFRR